LQLSFERLAQFWGESYIARGRTVLAANRSGAKGPRLGAKRLGETSKSRKD